MCLKQQARTRPVLLGVYLVIEKAVAEGHDAAAPWLENSEDLREDLLWLHSMAGSLTGKPAALLPYRHGCSAHADRPRSILWNQQSIHKTRSKKATCILPHAWKTKHCCSNFDILSSLAACLQTMKLQQVIM